MLKTLDLFSGIGGFSLGLERTGGFKTIAFCEIDPYCQKVLAKHWSDVPCFPDITKLRGDDVGPVDVVCGGFPCQDISFAGKGSGLSGARSALFYELARLVGEISPRFVLLENVAALLNRGLGDVLGELATLGYDAEWHCIPASAFGAPHRRDRIWIIAYNDSKRGRTSRPPQAHSRPADVFIDRIVPPASVEAWRDLVADVDSAVYGLSSQVGELRALGNAVVPQIPELIGHAILASLGKGC